MDSENTKAARSPAFAGAPLSRGARTAHACLSIAAWPLAPARLLQRHKYREHLSRTIIAHYRQMCKRLFTRAGKRASKSEVPALFFRVYTFSSGTYCIVSPGPVQH